MSAQTKILRTVVVVTVAATSALLLRLSKFLDDRLKQAGQGGSK